jgi:hypothetical protein
MVILEGGREIYFGCLRCRRFLVLEPRFAERYIDRRRRFFHWREMMRDLEQLYTLFA